MTMMWLWLVLLITSYYLLLLLLMMIVIIVDHGDDDDDDDDGVTKKIATKNRGCVKKMQTLKNMPATRCFFPPRIQT